MAIEKKFNQQDEDQNQQQSLGSGSLQPGGSSGGGAAPAQRPTTPSNRPNVQQYLGANQGAGEKLAGNIQKDVEKDASEVNKGIGQAQSSFQQKVNPTESNLGEQGSQKIQTAFKDPSSILNQQSQLDEFRRLQNQGYKQDIDSAGQAVQQDRAGLQNQFSNLNQRVDQAGNETGRFELLRSSLGQPNYTRGQQKLDQLFLQTQPGVGRTLQKNLQAAGKQVGQQLSGFDAATQSKLEQLQNLSGERAKQIQGLLSGGTSEGLESDISGRGLRDIEASSNQRLTKAQQDVLDTAALRQRLQTPGQLTAADAQKLGLGAGMRTYDVNLSDYITQGNMQPTLANAADPAEFARYRALQQLAGDTSGDIFSGVNEVGGFNPYEFRKDDLTAALDKQRTYHEQTRTNPLIDQMMGAISGYVNGGGSGMRGRRYNVPQLNQLAGTLSGIKGQQDIGFDRWQAMQDAVNTFKGQTGLPDFFGVTDVFAPQYQQIQQLRGNQVGGIATDDEDIFGVT
jgi:hypothetical protein